MKVLIVIPREKQDNKINYCYAFPTGLGYISSVLKKAGHKVDCVNLNHHAGTINSIINDVLDENHYDFVCTGGMTLHYRVIKEIINTVKNHQPNVKNIKTILGGIIITSDPETIFNLLNPDFAVIGEGEEAIIELLDYIDKKKDISEIKGIMFKNNKGDLIITGKREFVKNLDLLPWPDLKGIEFKIQLDNLSCNCSYLYNKYDYPRFYSVLGSRGCPLNCTFCYHYSKYRKRSMDNIMKELYTIVRKYHINIVLFYDECIALDKERMYELCSRMRKLRDDISWDLSWILQLTVHHIDDDLLRAMKESGVIIVSYGFESFSPIVLKSMNKPVTPYMIESAFKKTLNAGIYVQANFIFGDVAETKETAKITLNWWKENSRGQLGIGFIQPYPGSKIYKHCLESGIIKDKVDFIKNKIIMNNWFNMTVGMSDKEIKKLSEEIRIANVKDREMVTPLSVKTNHDKNYELKVKCPFCNKIIIYKNCRIKNKWYYSAYFICRKCNLRFFVTSRIKKFLYAFYEYYIKLGLGG